MGPIRRSRWLLTALLAPAVLACSGSKPTDVDAGPPFDAGPVFIALQADIANYRSWPVIVIPDGDTGEGPRWVYMNHPPPPGAPEWPNGTILVKESQVFGRTITITIDAMVKRGGGFNTNPNSDAGQAPNWEWMGLSKVGDAGAVIDWRGTQPPPNAGYGPVNGNCNTCHGSSTGANNDFVQLPADDAGFQAALPLLLSKY